MHAQKNQHLNQHLSDTYSRSRRDEELAPCREVITPPEPSILFNSKEPTLAEVRNTVRTAQTSSAPGPIGVLYKVSKHCPRLLRRLWRLIRVVGQRGKVVKQWRYAEGVWVPKEENASEITQFCTISLLSVEGKVFFKIHGNHLAVYLLRNSYRHRSLEGRSLRHARLHRAYWSGNPVDLRDNREQSIWIHSTQTCGNSADKTQCSREDQRPHIGLLH